MIEFGLLEESGVEQRTEAGRPKRQLQLRGDYGNFVGFDFDARNIFAVLVDFSGTTIDKRCISLSGRPSRTEVIEHLHAILDEFRNDSSGSSTLGIGIGVPGAVQQSDRIGLGYHYISDWTNVDLCSELNLDPEMLRIDNNTRTTALGEYWLGENTGIEHLVCITVRTGISAAIISDGLLLRGAHEMAGEIRGWSVIDTSDSANLTPAWLEDKATVRSISPEGLTSPELWQSFVSQCQEGDRDALNQLNVITKYHADAIARMIQLADPQVVVFSGSFNEIGEVYLDRIREATTISLLGQYFTTPPIRFVSLGQFTGAQGAAALAANHFKPS